MENNKKEEGTYRVWWDEKENLARSKIVGVLSMEQAEGLVKDFEVLMQKLKKRGINYMDGLNDASEAKLNTNLEFRKIIANFFKKKEFANASSAIFGLKTPQRIVMKFIVGMSGFKNIGFFETEKEALKWIRKLKKEREIKKKK